MRIGWMVGSLLFCLAVGAVAQAKDETHPFSVSDMLGMDRIGDPQVSPDGQRIVFTLRSTDMDANRGRTDLWLVGADGKGLRRLTSHTAGDFNPRWSKCGKRIWFLSTRSGSSQVWRIPVDGGEAEQITDLPLDVGNLVVSPAGGALAFSMDVFPEKGCPTDTKEKLDAREKSPETGVMYDQGFVRHWDTWSDGRRSHLFVWNCKEKKAVNLMAGMDADTPSKPFGGTEEITFSPDGKELVFTARNEGAAESWSTNFDLYVVPTDGSQPPTCLTESNPAWDTQPQFSPDGKILAWLAMERAGFEADRFRIVLKSWPDGSERVLTQDWDRSVSSCCWSADGKTIYATASNLGQTSLFAIDVKNGEVRTMVRDGTVGSVSEAGKRLILSIDNLKSPVELWSVRPDGKDLKAVTSLNAKKIAAARMGDYEQFTFKGWNDEEVFCTIVKPADFDPAQKYPIAFLIHGGPQGSFGNHFHYRWNPQAYAGAGYAVVMVDFHGSTGYGQAFSDAISGHWGDRPLEDLQKGLAAAIDRYSWMDGDRVAALGASYGGYMINWIAGNWPDRFRCLVNHDGILDTRGMYFDTEELWFPEWENGGTPWSNPEGYEEFNPVRYVENWKTPMLVVHGALDYRLPDVQGLGTFNALQRLGIPSKLLYFPDENHWVLKPHNSIQWHETVIEWMDRWCKE